MPIHPVKSNAFAATAASALAMPPSPLFTPSPTAAGPLRFRLTPATTTALAQACLPSGKDRTESARQRRIAKQRQQRASRLYGTATWWQMAHGGQLASDRLDAASAADVPA